MARLRVNYSKHARFCSTYTITSILIYQSDWYSYSCTIFDYMSSDSAGVMNITSSIVAFLIIIAIIIGIINFFRQF